MRAGRASETAEAVAAVRLAASRDPDPDLRLDDPHAARFLGTKWALLVGPLLPISLAIYRRRLPGMYEWIVARTRFFDQALARQIGEGLGQLVLLGAGYDTRAVRFAGPLRDAGTRVIEIDHPATQARKRALGSDGRAIEFVAADLSSMPLAAVLAGCRLDRARRTFFLWEGVTMYLTEQAVGDALAAMAAAAPAGSAIGFDFCARSMVDGTRRHYGGPEARRFVARRGEPLTWGIEAAEVPSFLAARGLHAEELLEPHDFEERFLGGAARGHKVTGFNRGVVARIA